ncbi:metallophosphoesterase [Roseococcus sp. SYP-B2431]|uniref:metallophosphoesterase family protein n=1 Tax=Roseococcus sp. SYP-B2431 TaxID=2496640 RepID=UPI00103D7815|nr:metallophosphoesterase [Roseococcus sp. SYP-B2431]TCH96160.1 metallophosphoesterase [Roseococcus sp. SYP-B2431]
MPRIAHLSDLHFGEASQALVESLAADVIMAQPDAVAVSGDLTRRASRDEFARAYAFLEMLGAPLLVLPGNHDIPHGNLVGRFMHPKRRWQRARPEDSADQLSLDGTRLIGLDTVSRAQWHLDWSAGGITLERRVRLAAELEAARGLDVIVVCHHPLRHGAWATARRAPREAGATIELLRAQGVKAVLCGHLHQAEMARLNPEGPLQVIAPSAFSPRGLNAPNGWNLVAVEKGELRVETREFLSGGWRGRELLPAG